MRSQIANKLGQVRTQIALMLGTADDVLASESTGKQRQFALSWARTYCRHMKELATPSVQKLTDGPIPDSKAWWTKTVKSANRFVSLLETIVARLDQRLDAKKTLAAVKELETIEASLRQRAESLGAVLDLPGLGKGKPPSELKRPDVAAIKSDLEQIVAVFRVSASDQTPFHNRQWEKARVILHRLNVRLGDPKLNSLWRSGLDESEADAHWLNAVGVFVESANMSFENLAEPNQDDARYMAGVLMREAEHALEGFGDAPPTKRTVELKQSPSDRLGKPKTKSAPAGQRKPKTSITDLERCFLIAMNELQRGTKSKPLSTTKIGRQMTPPKTRKELRGTRESLAANEMIGTITDGRNGGCWMLAKGARRLPKAQDRKKTPRKSPVS